jgi:hypothetical protein
MAYPLLLENGRLLALRSCANGDAAGLSPVGLIAHFTRKLIALCRCYRTVPLAYLACHLQLTLPYLRASRVQLPARMHA